MQAVEAVADAVRAHRVKGLVVDPVLVATSGDSLAGADVADAIVERLFPLATVVTPNIAEASVMLGARWWRRLMTVTIRDLVRRIVRLWGFASVTRLPQQPARTAIQQILMITLLQ